MPKKFSLLSAADEPTDEQLQQIMAEVLADVIHQKKYTAALLKKGIDQQKANLSKKYPALMLKNNGG